MGNRSYVIRSGHMSKLQRHALEEYLPLYSIPVSDTRIDIQEYFPRPAECIVEIGFGMGAATLELAEAFPEYNFIGIEVHPPGVGKILDEIHARSPGNLRVIYYDAVHTLSKMIPADSLAGVHIFFPDPWPKKRHHKRRLIKREFAYMIAEALKSNGYLYVVTDWEDYAWQIVNVLDSVESLTNMHEVFSPAVPWRPKTSFERKGIEKQHLIREILFRKRLATTRAM